jgi:hypothetical protein
MCACAFIELRKNVSVRLENGSQLKGMLGKGPWPTSAAAEQQPAAGRTTRSALTDALVSLRAGDNTMRESLRNMAGTREHKGWMSVRRKPNLVNVSPHGGASSPSLL